MDPIVKHPGLLSIVDLAMAIRASVSTRRSVEFVNPWYLMLVIRAMDNELIDLLRTVSSGFQARMKEQVAASGSGLTTFQARLVNLVGRHEGISQLRLGTLTDRDKAQVARAVKDLETRALVTRSAHPSDWRAKCLALTAAGKQMHARLNSLREDLAGEVLGALSDAEKRALWQCLEKMERALGADRF